MQYNVFVYSVLQISCLSFLDFAYLSWIHFAWTMGSSFIPSIIPSRMSRRCLNSSDSPISSYISELLFLFFTISSVFIWAENYFCTNGSFEYSLNFSIINLDDFFIAIVNRRFPWSLNFPITRPRKSSCPYA